jgi:hypothetical protein
MSPPTSQHHKQYHEHNIISVYTGYGVETNQIDVINTLTDKDKDAIIKSSRLALDKIVELVHLGSTISLKKLIVTNLTKKYAYKYDDL